MDTSTLDPRVVVGTIILLCALPWLRRLAAVYYHVYWTKLLKRAPRPESASLLEWLCLGHAGVLMKVREHGGVQVLLKRWHEAILSKEDAVSAFVIWLGPLSPNIILCDAQNAKHVLKNPKIYVKGFVYDAIRYVVPKGITNAEGGEWTRLRKLVTPCFHNRVVENFSGFIFEAAKKRVDAWQTGSEINCHEWLSQLTLSIIMQVTIGERGMEHEKASSVYTEFGKMMSYTAKCLVSPWRFVFGSRVFMLMPFPEHFEYKQRIRTLETVVQDAVQHRLRNGANKDENSLIEILISEYEKAANGEYNDFTYKHLSDQLGTFLAAGHDTTASLLSFTFYHILQPENRGVYDALVEEADRVLSEAGAGGFAYEDVSRLEYTNAVLKETLRVDSPGPIIARETLASNALTNGLGLPSGVSLWIAMYLLHNDPKQWTDVKAFNPGRFLSTAPKVGQYLPFSMGNRNCVGQRFAMIEASILLAYIVYTYDVALVRGQTMVRETAIVNRPKNGVHVTLTRRKHGRVATMPAAASSGQAPPK